MATVVAEELMVDLIGMGEALVQDFCDFKDGFGVIKYLIL